MIFITTLYLLSLVTWIGSIIFFSFLGAPALFRSLSPEYAGKAVSAIFPKYYFLGYIAGISALLFLLISGIKTGHWSVLKMMILVIMIILTFYSGLTLHPRARAVKEEIQSATELTDAGHLRQEFNHIHRLSVIYNGTVLTLGLILIFLTARGLTL